LELFTFYNAGQLIQLGSASNDMENMFHLPYRISISQKVKVNKNDVKHPSTKIFNLFVQDIVVIFDNKIS